MEKMYQQILIDSDQRHLQLILWREEPTDNVKIFQLNTVTYGTASAPFLSTKSLLQLSKEYQNVHVAQIIKEDFYVDDFLSGANTEDDLRSIVKCVTSILNSACLPLRQWRTNARDIFDHESNASQPKHLNSSSSQSRVLGLKWDPSKDILQFSVDINLNQSTTKRSILSQTVKLFDPLGLLSPCTVISKIILQKLWLTKLQWDDPVDSTIQNFASNLNYLPKFGIPRCVIIREAIEIELHLFSDASQWAYASAAYIKSFDSSGQVLVRLLYAKTKEAPIKTVTIPRFELCGALLSARLCVKILKALRCKLSSVFYWTDSTVVLGWLSENPSDLKPFVSNRVSDIQKITTTTCGIWKHVPGNMNPADLGSRGVNPKSIHAAKVWWEGPPFFYQGIHVIGLIISV